MFPPEKASATGLVFLTGPMGSGKSTVGRALALRLDLPFMDLDALIEAQAGQSISTIFEDRGEPAFRVLETAMLEHVVTDSAGKRVIVATGGGIVVAPENRAIMRRFGRVYYLHVGISTLRERLSHARQRSQRPLLGDADALADRICALLEQRRAAYADCDAQIDGDREVAAIVDDLSAQLASQQEAR